MQGTTCKLNLWSLGAGFFHIATINLLSLKRIKDSDFKNNFVIMKRERLTHSKSSLRSFSLQDIP